MTIRLVNLEQFLLQVVLKRLASLPSTPASCLHDWSKCLYGVGETSRSGVKKDAKGISQRQEEACLFPSFVCLLHTPSAAH